MRINKEKINSLNSSVRKRLYLSILLALFTLGVNIFAWFAFSAEAGLEVDATVASWDVEFKEHDQILSRDILVELSMKPGMPDYNKTIEVESKSDVQSSFRYEIDSFTLGGQSVDLTNKGDIYDYLEDFYPFSIRMAASKNTLSLNDNVEFTLDIVWPYESATPIYYGQDEVYSYNNTFNYFTKSGSTYSAASIANVSAYNSQKSSLYLEKDDADSYFGMMCDDYEETTGKACLVLEMRLIVEQIL